MMYRAYFQDIWCARRYLKAIAAAGWQFARLKKTRGGYVVNSGFARFHP